MKGIVNSVSLTVIYPQTQNQSVKGVNGQSIHRLRIRVWRWSTDYVLL